jgi:hypothetical protein
VARARLRPPLRLYSLIRSQLHAHAKYHPNLLVRVPRRFCTLNNFLASLYLPISSRLFNETIPARLLLSDCTLYHCKCTSARQPAPSLTSVTGRLALKRTSQTTVQFSQTEVVMKVVEKGVDRKAEVHIYVEGQVPALEEYGEHIDPVDKAICSYVPVEEGHQVKVGGRFSGTVSSPLKLVDFGANILSTDVDGRSRCRDRWHIPQSPFIRSHTCQRAS